MKKYVMKKTCVAALAVLLVGCMPAQATIDFLEPHEEVAPREHVVTHDAQPPASVQHDRSTAPEHGVNPVPTTPKDIAHEQTGFTTVDHAPVVSQPKPGPYMTDRDLDALNTSESSPKGDRVLGDDVTLDPAAEEEIQKVAQACKTPLLKIPSTFIDRLVSFFRDVIALAFRTVPVTKGLVKVSISGVNDILGVYQSVKTDFDAGGLNEVHKNLTEGLFASGDVLADWVDRTRALRQQLSDGVVRLKDAAAKGTAGAAKMLDIWQKLEAVVKTYEDTAQAILDLHQLTEHVPAVKSLLDEGAGGVVGLFVDFTKGMEGDKAKGMLGSTFGALGEMDSVEVLTARLESITKDSTALDALIKAQEKQVALEPQGSARRAQAEHLLGNLKRGRALLKTYHDLTSALYAAKKVDDVRVVVQGKVEAVAGIATDVKEGFVSMLHSAQDFAQGALDGVSSLWQGWTGSEEESEATTQSDDSFKAPEPVVPGHTTAEQAEQITAQAQSWWDMLVGVYGAFFGEEDTGDYFNWDEEIVPFPAHQEPAVSEPSVVMPVDEPHEPGLPEPSAPYEHELIDGAAPVYNDHGAVAQPADQATITETVSEIVANSYIPERERILGKNNVTFLNKIATDSKGAWADLQALAKSDPDEVAMREQDVSQDIIYIEDALKDMRTKHDTDVQAEVPKWESTLLLLVEYKYMLEYVQGKVGWLDVRQAKRSVPQPAHLTTAVSGTKYDTGAATLSGL